MYSKVFKQIFESSIAEDHVVRHVFMDLLVLANRHGDVDMTLSAISRITNVPLDIVSHSIEVLCHPDSESRTKICEGRRLTLLDDHRDWGWKIVNFEAYNAMRNEDARREYFRDYKAKQRSTNKINKIDSNVQDMSTVSTDVHTMSTVSTNTHASTDAPATTKKKHSAKAEEIYLAYPRKVGKNDAINAIEKALKSHSFDELLRATSAFALSPAGQNGKFTPHPATFFNQARYLDDPKEWEKTGEENGKRNVFDDYLKEIGNS
jgi:hypothetical protein